MPEDKINVHSAIEFLVSKLQKNSSLIYSERDLQFLLSKELLFMDNKIYPIKEKTGGTYRVHLEYPYGVKIYKNSHKFDIAVFCEKDIENITESLFVYGQNPDGSTKLLNGKKEIKRSIFCSHLIELKVRDKAKGSLKEFDIDYDFKALNEGYNLHEYFRNLYRIETKLFFIFYLNWIPKFEKVLNDQINLLKKFYGKANHDKIIFYLLIRSRTGWEKKLQNDELLCNYMYLPDQRIFFLNND